MHRIKRILCAVIVAAFVASCFAPYSFAVQTYTPGDANGDGTVNLADALFITRRCAGWSVSIDEYNSDCNGDDSVDLKDIVLIKRFLAGGWNVILGEATLTFDATTNGGALTNANGFSASDIAKKIVPGSAYKTADANGKTWPSDPKKYGCSFKGWYTQPTGGTKVLSTTVFSTKGNVTLYAHFGGYMETPEIGI